MFKIQRQKQAIMKRTGKTETEPDFYFWILEINI